MVVVIYCDFDDPYVRDSSAVEVGRKTMYFAQHTVQCERTRTVHEGTGWSVTVTGLSGCARLLLRAMWWALCDSELSGIRCRMVCYKTRQAKVIS